MTYSKINNTADMLIKHLGMSDSAFNLATGPFPCAVVLEELWEELDGNSPIDDSDYGIPSDRANFVRNSVKGNAGNAQDVLRMLNPKQVEDVKTFLLGFAVRSYEISQEKIEEKSQ